MGELDEDKQTYCICRSSDTDRFMIGCDNCNEWYHGDCISITEELAGTIKKFFCLMCRDKDSSLEIIFKEKKTKKDKTSKEEDFISDSCKESFSRVKVNIDYPSEIKRSKYIEEESDFYTQTKTKKPRKTNATKIRTNRKGKRDGGQNKRRQDKMKAPSVRNRNIQNDLTKKSYRKEKEVVEIDEGPKQCYGPGCIKAAIKGSKYCSEECGIKLAANRIYEILPQRLMQWQNTPSAADQFSHRELEEIKVEQNQAKMLLEELNVKQKELEDLITLTKSLPPATEEELIELDEKEENELMIYCVTCGHEISYKNALRHMERCFNKYESQTSFGSVYKTKIEGVFCDVYNPHQKTYCKRLRVLCPEHSKDPKLTDDEVCGFPLVNNCFELTGTFCRIPKKRCMKHYCWEKLRRAELDMERVQQWLKIDDLIEREQKIRFTMANRGSVLGLMLHQTIVHDN